MERQGAALMAVETTGRAGPAGTFSATPSIDPGQMGRVRRKAKRQSPVAYLQLESMEEPR
ncbi:MAG: hypothetical protein DMG24_07615 [Acidobacteria bacterium]|nr:MAG: hypothetical protein DMG24_07615 [Acidobacteriota bacterium]